MRNIFADKIYELSQKNEKIHVVVADISPAGSIENLKKYPNRFINVGVSEQIMAGISAGLALGGKDHLFIQLLHLLYIDLLK